MKYIPVDLQLLQPSVENPFQLYVLLGDRYIPYARDEQGFTEDKRRRLLKEGIRNLHIEEGERGILQEYMNRNLQALLHDPSLSESKKSEIVYQTCIYQLERLWEAPKAKEIEASKEIFRQSVDHVVSANHDAVRHMILMISHETSIYTHSVNVGLLGTSLAREVFRGRDVDLHEIGYAMFLHDIGKTRIDHRILNKPGPLTDEEWEIMKTHTEQGNRILLEEGHASPEGEITTLQHHERCDGRGYPRGLKSSEIDVLAKICNLVDSYDALLAPRVYKPPLSPFEALKIMREEMRERFDREIYKAFLSMLS